jgi:hypothetical protein
VLEECLIRRQILIFDQLGNGYTRSAISDPVGVSGLSSSVSSISLSGVRCCLICV